MDRLVRFFDSFSKKDSTTEKWLMITSLLPVVLSSLLYLIAVLIVLPAYMKDRKPFQGRKMIIIYNTVQVWLNIWIFFGLLPNVSDSFRCYPDGVKHPPKNNIKAFSYYFHLTKYLDFLDTIIFIVRKKYSQVTLLHLYHHSTMPLTTWFCVRYGPDGRVSLHALLNSFVHVFTYLYYLASILGPQVRRFLWWKKYITLLQMAQFVVITIHSIQSALYGCNVSLVLSLLTGMQSLIYMILFIDFYKKAYGTHKSAKETIGDFEVHKKNE
ncbi:unnamed protein product [Phyllotreta striolata]|uniref:Elongation of very long chain fatty acids protein n=1 Tax=Phyllotreta striolata TaxID=444603 RepID=A0A9N9XNG9_PHYSR|nr:unnamed protein product [Phyllotreta striolata]